MKNTRNDVVKNILEQNDYKNKLLDNETINTIKKIGKNSDKIIDTLQNSVKETHPQTFLTCEVENIYALGLDDVLYKLVDFNLDNPLLENDRTFTRTITSSKERKPEEFTPENRFADLINTVLVEGKEIFSKKQMKEAETKMAYDYIDSYDTFKNFRARRLARKFSLPLDWFSTKQKQMNSEQADLKTTSNEQRSLNKTEPSNNQIKDDSIKNQNLERIKDYLK